MRQCAEERLDCLRWLGWQNVKSRINGCPRPELNEKIGLTIFVIGRNYPDFPQTHLIFVLGVLALFPIPILLRRSRIIDLTVHALALPQ